MYPRKTANSEIGASTIEYAVLVGFLAVAVIGVLSSVGYSSRFAFCEASSNRGDHDGDGDVDMVDHDVQMAHHYDAENAAHSYGELTDQHFQSDLNCDGMVRWSNITDIDERDDDWLIFIEYYDGS